MSNTPKTWGHSAVDFYADHEGKDIVILLMNGDSIRGVLIGHDTYDLLLAIEGGHPALITKHAVAIVVPAASEISQIYQPTTAVPDTPNANVGTH